MNDTTEKSDCIRYLGAYLDETLSFRNHVKSKAAMLNFVKIREVRKFLTTDACDTLVMGLITSLLTILILFCLDVLILS